MKNCIILVWCFIGICLIGFSCHNSYPEKVCVTDFGAIPNDSINDLEAFNKCIQHCKAHAVREMVIPKGTYLLSHPEAKQLMNQVMNREMGENPEKVIFTPYYPYVKGMDLNGVEELKISGEGALLLCDGWMEPLSLNQASNVLIQGITIDYKRQPHSEGFIEGITPDYFDVKLDWDCPIENSVVMPRIMFFDTIKKRIAEECIYFPDSNKVIASGYLRIYAQLPASYDGFKALINHSFHFRPAIFIHESENITLSGVTIHSQPGMGIVGHRSSNITMEGMQIVPRQGKQMSTNTDATHFTSCDGFIHFKNCRFKGQGDDATNVHNYYYSLKSGLSGPASCIARVEAPTGTHAQVLDYPLVGDTLELVEKSSLKLVDKYQVVRVDTFPGKWEVNLLLDNPLPESLSQYLLINGSRLPSLRMEECEVESHLARAVLIKTRNVVISNCRFTESTGTAVHIGAEGWWHEGPGSANVVIRNNTMIRCGRGDGTKKGAAGIAVTVECDYPENSFVHHTLLFEGNRIEGEGAECGIYVSGASDVVIHDNLISGCKQPVIVENSKEVSITKE